MKTAWMIACLVSCLPIASLGQGPPSQNPAYLALRARAEKGDAEAQFELGFQYEFRPSVTAEDYAEALKWYRRAAAQNHAGARMSIARMYFVGDGVPNDYDEAARWYRCPKPAAEALAACRLVSSQDLPAGAFDLMKKMGCDAGPNYDYGSEVDLNGDGEPEYQFCCHPSPHGPCGAVVIGKVGAVPAPPDKCVPAIWNFVNGRYRSVPYTPAPPPKIEEAGAML
jgi:hypothetical protein